MSDYCRQCSLKVHGRDHRDLARLCEPGETVWELCEGCGGDIEVDYNGMRVERDAAGEIVNGANRITPKRSSRLVSVLRFFTGYRGRKP